MDIKKKIRCSLLCLLLCLALLPVSGCEYIEQLIPVQEMQPSEPPVDYGRLAAEGLAQLEETRELIVSVLPEQYTAAVPQPAAYSVSSSEPNSTERIESWMQEQQMLLFAPAVTQLIAEESALCQSVVGESGAQAVASAADVLRSELASIQSLPDLYGFAAGVENSLFEKAGVACTPENADSFVVCPVFETTADGRVLLTLRTNFPLPGFEDGSCGYLLRLFLDGGKTEQTVADSLYAHEHITYGSSYSVTFDLSSILRNVTPEQYFAGRNRVTFTLFARDNSFSWSEEFYKLRYTEGQHLEVDDRRADLAQIIIQSIR